MDKKDPSYFGNKVFKNISPNVIEEYMNNYLDVSFGDHNNFKVFCENLIKIKSKQESKNNKAQKNKHIELMNYGYIQNKVSENAHKGNEEDFLSSDKERKRVSGRKSCDCLAQKHALINNCLSCGRIVCSKEGAGVCLTCGALVIPQQSSNNFNMPSKQKAASKALNRLLKQQQNQGENTQVYDDQCDYFTYDNKWLSWKERREIQKLEEISDPSADVELDIDIQRETISVKNVESNNPTISTIMSQRTQMKDSCDINIYDYYNKVFKNHGEKLSRSFDIPSLKNNIKNSTLVKDQDLSINSLDICFVIDQPFASLIVCSKLLYMPTYEYVSYRGEAWIASSKTLFTNIDKTIQDDCIALKSQFNKSRFPQAYLLGRIVIGDCLLSSCVDISDKPVKITSPYVCEVECISVFFQPLPFSCASGLNKLPLFMKNLLIGISKSNYAS